MYFYFSPNTFFLKLLTIKINAWKIKFYLRNENAIIQKS